METDSLILQSIMEIEPPPLLKVWGVIDWQNEQRGMKTIKKDRKYLKFMGCRPFNNWGSQISRNLLLKRVFYELISARYRKN